MLLYFYTQDYENYGSAEKPYWKPKGGSDFILDADEWTESMIDNVYSIIEKSDEMYISDVIGHQEVNSKFITDSEQMQLENEGGVEIAACRLTYNLFMKKFDRC